MLFEHIVTTYTLSLLYFTHIHTCPPTLPTHAQLQEPRDYEQEVSIGDKDLYWEPPDDPIEIHRQMTVRGYPRIPASELKLLGKLGEGEFGDVFKGERRLGDAVKIVAVKSLKAGADKSERVKLLKEAAIMGQFKHPNVVEFLGVRLVDDKPGEVGVHRHTELILHTICMAMIL